MSVYEATNERDRIYFPVANNSQVNTCVPQAHLALPSFSLITKSNNAHYIRIWHYYLKDEVPVVKRCSVKLLKIPPIMKQA